MATFLDLGLLTHFAIIFPFLLVFVVTYAILIKFKLVSEENSINAIIALAFASMTLFSKTANALIITASPWFVVMFMLILFVILGFRLLGISESKITGVMEKEFGTPHWLIIVMVGLIIIGSMGVVFGPGLLQGKLEPSATGPVVVDGVGIAEGSEGQFQANVADVLFHPKVIGFAALMLIVVFAIRTLMYESGSSSEGKE